MSSLPVYLAKSRASSNQRAHFAIFIVNAEDNHKDPSKDFRSIPCKGTIINVVGEPIVTGFVLEFERNHDCSTSQNLREMVLLGHVDSKNVYTQSDKKSVKESTPRGVLDREASMVIPPRGGQEPRAPVDGVATKRCQEWTMEYLRRLVEKGLMSPEAIEIAQDQRDPPNHGIFGQKASGRK